MSKTETETGISRAIAQIVKTSRVEMSFEAEIRKAFLLGLWYKQLPEYVAEHMERAYAWDLKQLDPQADSHWEYFEKQYPNIFKFNFIANTGDSWHQCYRDIRSLGWQRLAVHREGGELKYLFQIHRDDMPSGYNSIHLVLNITISTCRQVQIGTKTVEQPIFETKCDDLKEIDDTTTDDNQVLGPGSHEILEQHTGHHDSDEV